MQNVKEPQPFPDPTRPPQPDPMPDPDPERGPAPLDEALTADDLPEPARIGFDAIPAALRAGWRDFRKAPAFGLLFSAFYVLGGLVLTAVLSSSGREWWLIPFILGFPLIAPFAAVGIYEVSREIEAGRPLIWPRIAGAVFRQKDRQIPSMSVVILLMFMLWVFAGHTIFALFMGTAPLTTIGWPTLLTGTLVGGLFYAALFSFTVVGLPLLLDREVDFISAIIVSIEAVKENPAVMAAWAALIGLGLFVAILPLFLGLFVALPAFGHASWHMYRRLMPDDPIYDDE